MPKGVLEVFKWINGRGPEGDKQFLELKERIQPPIPRFPYFYEFFGTSDVDGPREQGRSDPSLTLSTNTSQTTPLRRRPERRGRQEKSLETLVLCNRLRGGRHWRRRTVLILLLGISLSRLWTFPEWTLSLDSQDIEVKNE